nr:T9SS type A sorting domain-containing protein [Melioribacteraceae bacterium]
TKLINIFPNLKNFAGNFSFGLSSEEDKVELLDNNDNILNEVHYNADWILNNYFVGNTLSLKNPMSDNSKSENWTLSHNYGTPGYINDIYTFIENEEISSPTNFVLYQNFPNPFNPTTTIGFSLPGNNFIDLAVYNLLGQKIETLYNGNLNAGNYSFTFNGNNLSSGIYFYTLKVNDNNIAITKKMLLIK